jgi:hypothetical protein
LGPHFDYVTDGTTFTNPLGLVFTFAMCVLLVALPRKYALLPVVGLICYMTMGMRIMVAGLNFTMIRILLLFACARVVARREFRQLRLVSIDKAIIWFIGLSVVTYTLLWRDFDSVKWILGTAYNVFGFYFLFRCLLRNTDDISRLLKMTAILIVPLAGLMLLEKTTGRNEFAMFGGVPEITFVREGKLRCEGPFAHPILAGTFGATLFPYFVALLWQKGKAKWIGLLGMASAIVIVVTCASSGPLCAWLASCVALGLWHWRRHMRVVRWSVVGALVGLQLTMKAPVWFVIDRVGFIAGSDAYHRAYLIDRWIYNFWDWWLVGTRSTNGWAAKDDHLFDVTNNYVIVSANGGLITLILFLVVIVRSFRAVGLGVRAAERHGDGRSTQMIIWGLGASLLAHAVSYISIAYFDQNFVNWYLLLAMIATLPAYYSAARRHAPSKTVRQPAPSLSEADANWVPVAQTRQFSSLSEAMSVN